MADDLSFLHFGTSSEILDHLGGSNAALVGRRHLCSIPATTASDISASSIILSSKVEPGVSIGEDSMVYDSSLSGGIQIGSQAIVVGVSIPVDFNSGSTEDSFRFLLPDRHCLWEVPLNRCTEKVIIYCGLHDNPKVSFSKNGTFCGQPWKTVLHGLGIQETDLWNSSDVQDKCLWNAKIFPILPYFEMLRLGMWFMGLVNNCKTLLPLWRSSKRVSLEELHRSIDFPKLCLRSSNHQADLAAGFAKACMTYGILGRNLSQLCDEILQKEISGVEMCRDFLALCPKLQAQSTKILPQSRAYQVQVDLLRACGEETKAISLEPKVWGAVAQETASAVRPGFGGKLYICI